MSLATFWAILSQTHLVTLHPEADFKLPLGNKFKF
jgi:hypothetical protein